MTVVPVAVLHKTPTIVLRSVTLGSRVQKGTGWGGGDVLFHDQDDVVLRLEGVVELDEVHVVQLVHDTDLVLHIVLGEGGLV